MKNLIFIFGMLLPILCVAQDQVINGNFTATKSINVGENIPDKFGVGTKLQFGGVNSGGDPLSIYRYSEKENFSDLRVNIGDDGDGDDRFCVGNVYWKNNGVWKDWFVVTNRGRVGIGVSNPVSALEVNGTIRAKEVKIEATGWADFVFKAEYNLQPLNTIEAHINEYGHLPNIPSEAEVKENGVDIGEMQIKLLQKIEELTLYTIQQQKQLEEQNKQIQELQQLVKSK